MKVLAIAVAGVSFALIALTLVPAAGDLRPYLAIGALIGAAVALAVILAGWRERPAVVPVAAPPAAPPAPVPSGEADVVVLLAALQERGRFIDFLADDIGGYADAQVGAAARVVHQGCKGVLEQYARIVPVRAEAEGATISVAPGFPADEYRLVGKISGSPPLQGTLIHRGWKVASVNLPRVTRADDGRLPVIAPAEVDVR